MCQPMMFFESNTYIRGSVGDASIGLPYMCNPLFLDDFEEWSDLSLFSTKVNDNIGFGLFAVRNISEDRYYYICCDIQLSNIRRAAQSQIYFCWRK